MVSVRVFMIAMVVGSGMPSVKQPLTHSGGNHDQQFPDEPKQIRPGEDITAIDRRLQVAGQVAVMAINEMHYRLVPPRRLLPSARRPDYRAISGRRRGGTWLS